MRLICDRTMILRCTQICVVSLASCAPCLPAMGQAPQTAEPPSAKPSDETLTSDPNEALLLAGRYSDKWHERAANLGSSTGQRYAGYFLVTGIGTAPDVQRGLKLTREAADGGDAFAMINMAVFHTQGAGVTQDAAQAKPWIERAAATGHWMGQLEKGAGKMLGVYGFRIGMLRAH